MNEMLNTTKEAEKVSEVEKSPVENSENTQEALEIHENLKKEVQAEEAANSQKYEQILSEAKMNPEQDLATINNKIAELQKSVDENSQDYRDLFISYSYDTPGVNSSFKKNSVEKMAKENKYPNMDKIADAIKKAREASQTTKSTERADNLLGKVFGVKKRVPAEISEGVAQAIENALTSGTPGLNASTKSWQNVVEFLSKKAPDLLKTKHYQDIIGQLGRADAEYMEANKDLVIKPEEAIDQPTCVRDSVATVNDEKIKTIKELEGQKVEIESKMQNVA